MIDWNQEDLEDPANDLCTTFNGKYVDVVFHHLGTWTAMYDNVRIEEGFPTREDAMQFLETYLGK